MRARIVREVLFILVVLGLAAGSPAVAQDPNTPLLDPNVSGFIQPEDVKAIPAQASYIFRAEWREGYAEVCFFREDNRNTFACRDKPVKSVATGLPVLHPTAGVPYVELKITMANPGFDIAVRAYAILLDGTRSPDSENRATVDNTAKGGPFMLP